MIFPYRKLRSSERGAFGVTLVELLISMAIIVAVMAVAVPVVRLATDGNKIASAADQVSSFISSTKAEAQENGRSFLIFERNQNNPNLCYRIYRGKPRPNYRGEDATSYAVPAGVEIIDVGTADAISLRCMVFYIYNADPAKLKPFQFLSLDGRAEQYEILKTDLYNKNTSGDVATAGMLRPVVKVFARENFAGPGVALTPMTQVASSNINTQVGPWGNWIAAFAQDTNCEFWPNSPLWLSSSGYDIATDVPRPGVMTYGYSVTQPPYVDELDNLVMPEGVAVHLNGSGFDFDGVRTPTIPGATVRSFFEGNQFAWPNDASDSYADFVVDFWSLEDNANAANVLSGETQIELDDPVNNFRINLPIDSQLRTAYFPMVEFNARGQIERVFACSPFLTAVYSHETEIVRSTPFYPTTPMYLLVGNDTTRGAMSVVGDGDYWVTVNQSTGRIGKAKAEDNAGDLDGDGFVTVKDSRLVSVGGISE